jgi:hypothetical protein
MTKKKKRTDCAGQHAPAAAAAAASRPAGRREQLAGRSQLMMPLRRLVS